MIEMEKPRVECVEKSEDGKYARFEVEPLERGYGTTLGNSLRRVLLSSLPGAAATSVKIDGVLHEFSSDRKSTRLNSSHELTHSFPTRRSSDLNSWKQLEKSSSLITSRCCCHKRKDRWCSS